MSLELNTEADLALAHLDRLETDGYVILSNPLGDDFFGVIEEAALRAEKESNTKPGTSDFDGVRTLRTMGMLAQDRIYEELVIHPAILGIVESQLGADCQLGSVNLFTIMPGETIQPMHSDHSLQPRRCPGVDTTRLVPGYVAILAITDFTAANGGTRIVPGSHKWEPLDLEHHGDLGTHIEYAGHRGRVVAAEMERGDVLIFDSRIWHGGGVNRSKDRRRSGLFFAYWAGWLRADENNLLLLSKDRIRSMPRRLQELVGLSRFDGHWGHFAGRDPMDWLDIP